MNIKLFIFSLLSLFHLALKAQIMTPSVPLDSVYANAEHPYSTYIYYKVNKNQTLYSISRTFQISIDSIKSLNSELNESLLREHSTIKIPLDIKRIQSAELEVYPLSIKLFYRIKAGENLYQLCKRKFNLNLQELKRINHLNSVNIREGTVLMLGYYELENSRIAQTSVLESNAELPVLRTNPLASLQFTKSSKGVAMSQQDQLGSGRLFALHNEAEMDSYIEIENPVLNRKIYAKVIGRIPPIYERDIQIIISSQGAKLLGAVDKRFFISLKYR